MADPFEVRMRFTNQLQHLNASTTSALKAANYALKYAEFSDDLHSCILEQLERNSMNNRANIMYFLPPLCDSSRAQGENAYVRMLERDILRIVDLVAPDDGRSAANVKVVRNVLQQLQQKEFLSPTTMVKLDEHISGRDQAPSSPNHEPTPADAEGSVLPPAARSTPQTATREATGLPTSAIRLDKRQIEQRIEEDRERHKRAREGIWAVSQKGMTSLAEDGEFGRLWEEALDLADDDYGLAKEEIDERRRCLDFEDIRGD